MEAAISQDFQFSECIDYGNYGSLWKQSDIGAAVQLYFPNTINRDTVFQHLLRNIGENLTNHENIVNIINVETKKFKTRELQNIFKILDGVRPLPPAHQFLADGMKSLKHLEAISITLELCGKNLRHWLSNPQISSEVYFPDIRVKIIKGLISGLQHLHSNKIIHRDLKPENAYFSIGSPYKLPIKIGDLGLTRRTFSVSNAYTPICNAGTNYYQAPEIRNGHYDHKVDLYSLGLIIREIFQIDQKGIPANQNEVLKFINQLIIDWTQRQPDDRKINLDDVAKNWDRLISDTTSQVFHSTEVRDISNSPSQMQENTLGRMFNTQRKNPEKKNHLPQDLPAFSHLGRTEGNSNWVQGFKERPGDSFKQCAAFVKNCEHFATSREIREVRVENLRNLLKKIIVLAIFLMTFITVASILHSVCTNHVDARVQECNFLQETQLLKPLLINFPQSLWDFCDNDPIAAIISYHATTINGTHPNIKCANNVKTIDLSTETLVNDDIGVLLSKFLNLERLTFIGKIQCSHLKQKIFSSISLPIASLQFVDATICDEMCSAVANKLNMPCLQSIELECCDTHNNKDEFYKQLTNSFPTIRILQLINDEFDNDVNQMMSSTTAEIRLKFKECSKEPYVCCGVRELPHETRTTPQPRRHSSRPIAVSPLHLR